MQAHHAYVVGESGDHGRYQQYITMQQQRATCVLSMSIELEARSLRQEESRGVRIKSQPEQQDSESLSLRVRYSPLS